MPIISAATLIDGVLDENSYVSWDDAPNDSHVPAGSEYARELAAAAERAGVDESVVTGEGLLAGRRVGVVLSEFAFLGGSIGRAAAERIVRAVEYATSERLPLLVSPSSGGTRMHEGTMAFLQMVKIAAAISAHKATGLPALVYLRHPTTGGALASWGSLGHVTAAQPGALIGFLGPRVYEALYGEPFPEGVQLAENLYAKGLVDAVVAPEELRKIAVAALEVLMPRPGPVDGGLGDATSGPILLQVDQEHAGDLADVPAWESIRISRRADRPGMRELLRHAAVSVVPLNGTAAGEKHPSMLLALAKFGHASCIVLGQDREGQPPTDALGPAALREARRGIGLSRELHLPLVTIIDTPGAALSQDAEEGGLAGEIARCLADLVTLEAPTLSVILGQGTGGGALALIPADHTICAQHGWLSPLPPEGASVIVHRDLDHAPQMAAQQRVRSRDLLDDGVVDAVVPEHPDAADEPVEFARRLGRAIRAQLDELVAQDPQRRLVLRFERYRRLGY